MDSPAEAVIDLSAVTGNVAAMRKQVNGSQLMAVVKADGYGHGMLEAAYAARQAGAPWVGVATLAEAGRIAEQTPGAVARAAWFWPGSSVSWRKPSGLVAEC